MISHAFLIIAVLFPPPVFAEDKILVTATRNAEDANSLPFSVDSVTADRWDAAGGNAESALASVPGLSFTSSGAAGQTRSLLLRGAKAEHTLVLIDGIPVNDPLSPSRAFDFGQIPVTEIDHIEIIKGPQSVLYGSDAMGGVVQIFTKKGSKSRMRVEGGSYNTLKADLASMGFRAGYFETKGFSSADTREGNSEADGHQAWNLGGSKDFPLNDHFLMRLNAQYQDTKTDTDRNGGLRGDSYNTFARQNQFLLREENVVLLPAETELTVAGNYSTHNREDNTNGGDYYKAGLWKVEAIARKSDVGPQSFTLGSEYSEEGGRSSQTTGGWRKFRAGGIYLQDQLKLGRFNTVAGARIDFHSETETTQTYRLGLGYWLIPATLRARGSIGTGFKAPSLYQTYSSFGSPHLRPEHSVGGDLGLELTGENWQTELTAFANRFTDLIDFNLVTNRYFNQSRAETYGLEWAMERTWGLFRAGNALTAMRAVDPDSGLLLLRRPRWSDTLELGVRREKKFSANLITRYVGSRIDSHPVLLSRQTMPSFFTLGVNFFHSIGDGLRIVGRGENLLDRHYQETSGYGVPALSGYAGIEADL